MYHNFSAALYADAKLVGKEEGVEKALAFTEVHAANSSGNGAADGNGTDVARLVLRDCDDSGSIEELVRYWVITVIFQTVSFLWKIPNQKHSFNINIRNGLKNLVSPVCSW